MVTSVPQAPMLMLPDESITTEAAPGFSGTAVTPSR